MMASVTWKRIRPAIIGAVTGRQDTGLGRVAGRLAAQTVVLVLVMLIALEVVVYVITRQALLGALDNTLTQRALQTDPGICSIFHGVCGPVGTPGGPGGPGQGGRGQGPRGGGFPRPRNITTGRQGSGPNPSEASVTYVNQSLKVVHGEGALGTILLDVQDARKVLLSHTDRCCSEDQYSGQTFRVYTMPLWTTSGTVVGAIQTTVSEHQYQETMQTLLQELLVVALLGVVISSGISVILVRRALQPIRAAIQRQRDFVADAAHELRTPLAIMRTVGEVGMAEPLPDELQATIAQMLGENQHLTRLVEDLSLLARTDTNTVSIDRRPMDLSSLVTETVDEIEPLAEGQGVVLKAEVPASVQGLGDVLRLRQLLLILLDNALKHTPEGGTVAVRLYSQGERVRLQVADSGPGIDPKDLSRVFDRFFRSDRARTGEGSGLGLAIGKWIVEAHGGQIQASNAAPHGAVFTVTLPTARAAAS